jgi:hypothetical protein
MIEGTCGARAAKCLCIKSEDHVENGDDVHACDPKSCGGSWRGDMEGGDFEPVTFPLLGAL